MGVRVRKSWSLAILVSCFLIYAGLRVSNTLRSLDSLRRISDTNGYLRIAKEDIFNTRFFANDRPLGYPLFLKVVRGNEKGAAILQTVISVFSWTIFALILTRQFRQPGLKLVGVLLSLLFSLGHYVIIWDTVILTESLSLSLTVLVLAGWLWLLEDWDWHKAAFLVFISFAWAFTRDTNYWLLLLIAILTAVFGIRRRSHWRWLAAIFLLTFWLAQAASEYGQRWIFPFQNVLGTRILPYQTAVDFFAACGMPVTDNLLSLAGGTAEGNNRAFYNDPALDEYREWLRTRGKTCYLKWLAFPPSRSLIQPLEDFPNLVAFKQITRFYTKTYQAVLPLWLEKILYPQIAATAAWIVSMVLAVLTGYSPHWRHKPLWIVWAVLTLSLYPHLFLVWHGDTLGLDRHALSVVVGYYLSIWFFVLLTLDRIYERKNDYLA